jgi:hypothetical protein
LDDTPLEQLDTRGTLGHGRNILNVSGSIGQPGTAGTAAALRVFPQRGVMGELLVMDQLGPRPAMSQRAPQRMMAQMDYPYPM